MRSRTPKSVLNPELLALAVLLPLLTAAACLPRHRAAMVPAEPLWREELRSRWENAASFRAEAGFSLTDASGSYPGRLALAMKKPGRARADILDPFGRLRGLLIISGARVTQYLPGPADPDRRPPEMELLDRLAADGGASPAEKLSALVTGQPGPFLEEASFRWDEPAAQGPEGEGEEIYLTLEEGRTVPVLISLALSGGDRMTVEYDDWKAEGGVPVPGRVSLRSPGRGWSMEIRWGDAEFNAEIEDELFETGVPSGG